MFDVAVKAEAEAKSKTSAPPFSRAQSAIYFRILRYIVASHIARCAPTAIYSFAFFFVNSPLTAVAL